MRKIVPFILMLFACSTVLSQTKPSGLPALDTRPYVEHRGYYFNDSGIFFSPRPPNWTPKQGGATTYNNGIVYYYNGSAWVQLSGIGGSIDIVATISALQSYAGTSTTVIVTDAIRGGLFNKSNTGTADNGITFTASGGGYWVRDISQSKGVLVDWWNAKNDSSYSNSLITRQAIQSAIYYLNTYSNKGGTVRFGKGHYVVDISVPIIVPSNITIEGDNGTVIEPNLSTIIDITTHAFPLANGAIICSGDPSTGNRSDTGSKAVSNITIRNITIKVPSYTHLSYSANQQLRGISIVACTNLRIENCHVENTPNTGIYVLGCSNFNISNNRCIGNGFGTSATVSKNGISAAGYVVDSVNNGANNSKAGVISGNICNYNKDEGIQYGLTGGLDILSNVCIGNGDYGIEGDNAFVSVATQSSAGIQLPSQYIISENFVDGTVTNNPSSLGQGGISLGAGNQSEVTISHNTINNVSGKSGINIEQNADGYAIVDHNILYAVSPGASQHQIVIHVRNAFVNDNKILKPGTTNSNFGIFFYGQIETATIHDNYADSGLSSMIRINVDSASLKNVSIKNNTCLGSANNAATIAPTVAMTINNVSVVGNKFLKVNVVNTSANYPFEIKQTDSSYLVEINSINIQGNEFTYAGNGTTYPIGLTNFKTGSVSQMTIMNNVFATTATYPFGKRSLSDLTGLAADALNEFNNNQPSQRFNLASAAPISGTWYRGDKTVNNAPEIGRPIGWVYTSSGWQQYGLNGVDYYGTGSPEGVVSAPTGSIYRRAEFNSEAIIYLKQNGTGNTGWIPVQFNFVPNTGYSQSTTDGTSLTGSSLNNSITSTSNTTGSTGFPNAITIGNSWVFNGNSPDPTRVLQLWYAKQDFASDLWFQRYNSSGVDQGYRRIIDSINIRSLNGLAKYSWNHSGDYDDLTLVNKKYVDSMSTGAVGGSGSQGDIIYFSASNTIAHLSKDANATRYLSNQGTSNNPSWNQVNLANGVTGTLVVGNGGTGNTTFTAYSVITAGTTATGAFQNVSGVGSSGQVLTSNGAGALPTWQTASGAVSSVSNSDGTLTISPTTGDVVASIALGHANTWTGNPTFSGVTTTFSGNVSTASNFGTTGLGIVQTAATYTSTTSSGTVALTGVNTFAQPTLAASSSTTLTSATTAYFAGAPIAGTNVTVTTGYTLYVAAGTSSFQGGLTTGNTVSGANFGAIGTSAGGTTTAAGDLFGGASTVNLRANFNGTSATTAGANNSVANVIFGAVPVTEASSGTHAIITNAAVLIPTVTNGTATTTDATSLYVQGAPTGITATNGNTALWVAGGMTRLGGTVGINTATASAQLHVIQTTEQLRLGYDASNYMSFTVGSTGSTTFALTGTSPIFTFSQAAIFSSSLTVGTANNIVGTATNNNATAGNIGEYVSSLIAVGSAVSLTTATAANITSISLTAGDWDVTGTVNYSETTSTVTARSAGITSTSATVPSDGSEGYCGVQSTVTSEKNSITISRVRFSLSGTTTVYLVGSATFSAGTCVGFGNITARRTR